MERINCKAETEVWQSEENILQLRHWVSLRGQTLCRTGGCCYLLAYILRLMYQSAGILY